MSSKPKLSASGGVILREYEGQRQVLIVHRPHYDDWSLPKGKGKSDELPPQTAIREIAEETGIQACLDLRLPTARYPVSKGIKMVHFWRGRAVTDNGFRPNDEVDTIRWLNIEEALTALSYETDRDVVHAACQAPPTVALLIVRHGKAMQRKHWTGKDQKRRLSSRGRAQAQALAPLLAAFGVTRAVSSSSTRCMESLGPYCEQAGIEIEADDALSEEQAAAHPQRVLSLISALQANLREPTVVCGHRPVLPLMFQGLDLTNRAMVVGECIAMHYAVTGELLGVEVFKPTA